MPYPMPQTEARRAFHVADFVPHDPCGYIPKPNECLRCAQWEYNNEIAVAMYPLNERIISLTEALLAMRRDPTTLGPVSEAYWSRMTIPQVEAEIQSIEYQLFEICSELSEKYEEKTKEIRLRILEGLADPTPASTDSSTATSTPSPPPPSAPLPFTVAGTLQRGQHAEFNGHAARFAVPSLSQTAVDQLLQRDTEYDEEADTILAANMEDFRARIRAVANAQTASSTSDSPPAPLEWIEDEEQGFGARPDDFESPPPPPQEQREEEDQPIAELTEFMAETGFVDHPADFAIASPSFTSRSRIWTAL